MQGKVRTMNKCKHSNQTATMNCIVWNDAELSPSIIITFNQYII